MKKLSYLSTAMLGLFLMIILSQCSKKEENPDLTLSTMTAGNSDLNGASAPSDVAVDAVITATFSTNIDANSLTSGSVVLTRDYDDSVMDVAVSVSGNMITITPKEVFGNGTKYILDIMPGILSSGGKSLTDKVERSFTTVGTFAPAGAVAYWNFNGNADDQMGQFNPAANGVTDITYVASRNDSAGMAAKFNGTTSLIEIPNGDMLNNTNDFTLSFWVKEDTTGKSDQFVMGIAGYYGFQFEINSNGNNGLGECKLAAQYSLSNGQSASQDLWFNGGATGTTKDNGGWKGWTYCKDLTTDGTGVNGLLDMQWAQVVCVYNSATKIGTIYINGEEMKQQDFNLYGSDNALSMATGLTFAGNPGNNDFVFGFIQDKNSPTLSDTWANYSDPTTGHFQGELDDVRVYHKALTAKEIQLMYASEK